jgi:hypothetical protein
MVQSPGSQGEVAIRIQTTGFKPVVRICSHLIRIQIQHFRLKTVDPIRIQGFDDQKIKNNLLLQKKLFILDQKQQFTYPLASIKNFQATEEAFSPQKRTSST